MDLAKNPINWGSIPDWIAGIGSVLAFAAIVWTLMRDNRRRHEDNERFLAAEKRAQDAKEQADAERRYDAGRQARLVFGEIINISQNNVNIQIHNRSDGFVLDFDAAVFAPPADDSAGLREVAHDRAREIAPGGRPRNASLDVFGAHPLSRPDNSEIEITFTDQEGRRWRRRAGNAPQQIE